MIPGPAADEALRKATENLEGRLLVGVINSIGVRRDAEAVTACATTERLGSGRCCCGCGGLGKIADEAAIAQLQQALANAPESTQSAIAEGCLLARNR